MALVDERENRWRKQSVEKWQKDLLEAIILGQQIALLEEIRKHCNCPYIEQKLRELKQRLGILEQRYGSDA